MLKDTPRSVKIDGTGSDGAVVLKSNDPFVYSGTSV
jgi:hypothetical protein